MSKLKEVKLNNVEVNYKNNVAYVIIDNPPANALNSNIIEELKICFDAIKQELGVKAIVITGKGKFFVAGADIKEFQTAFNNEVAGENMARKAQKLFNDIESINTPVIAAINGACLGGGMELALSCDLRISSNEAVLGQPELNLGLIPGFGGTQRLPRLINKAKALEMILTGKNIKGEEAEQLGLVNKSVDSDKVLLEAERLAEEIANHKSSITVSATIDAVNNGLKSDLKEGLAYEAKLFGKMFSTSDMQEGVSAFIEKRTPEFTDR